MNLTLIAQKQFQNTINIVKFQISIKKQVILFGRGDQLHKKFSQNIDVVDLNHIDSSVSRIHACMLFSPGWFRCLQYMPWMDKVSNKWNQLPQQLFSLIYQFIKPRKMCLLKDLNSMMGLYEKIEKIYLQKNLIISYGDNRNIKFIEEIIINQQLLQKYNRQNWIIKGYQSRFGINNISFYKLIVQNKKYLLTGIDNIIYTIGRSSAADIVINHSSISRKQGLIKYLQGKWILIDGNGISSSINGTWKKINKLLIDYTKKYTIKLGRTMIELDFNQ